MAHKRSESEDDENCAAFSIDHQSSYSVFIGNAPKSPKNTQDIGDNNIKKILKF